MGEGDCLFKTLGDEGFFESPRGFSGGFFTPNPPGSPEAGDYFVQNPPAPGVGDNFNRGRLPSIDTLLGI